MGKFCQSHRPSLYRGFIVSVREEKTYLFLLLLLLLLLSLLLLLLLMMMMMIMIIIILRRGIQGTSYTSFFCCFIFFQLYTENSFFPLTD